WSGLEHLDESDDERSPIERIADHWADVVVTPLRAALRFDDPRARARYQAEADDSKAVLLLKLLAALSDPWVRVADKKRLRKMLASLPRYALRQPVPPFRRPGPRATFTRSEWRAVKD